MLRSVLNGVRTRLKRLYFRVLNGWAVPDRLLYAVDEPRGERPLRIIRGRHVIRGWALLKDETAAPRMRIRVNRALYPARTMPRADVREAHPRSPAYTELSGFELALQLGLGVHLVRVEVALAPGVWRPLSTAVIASLGLRRRPAPRIDYQSWTALDDAWAPLERVAFQSHVDTMIVRPHFDVVVRSGGAGQIETTCAALERQIYRNFTLTFLDTDQASPAAGADDGYRMFLRSGDVLADDALYAFADRVNADEDLDLLYADEDLMDVAGRRQAPFFKPDWSPSYLAAANYLGRAVAFSNRSGLSDASTPAELVALGAGRAAHVQRVLLHRPVGDASGLRADAGQAGAPQRPRAPANRPNVLLVLMPNGGTRAPADWIRETTYPSLSVVRGDPGPASDVGARTRLNVPVNAGLEDVLVVVNDDLTPVSTDWIEALVDALDAPWVGAAGPTLLDRASGQRHVGLTNDDGEPGPIRVAYGSEFTPATPRDVLGVSAACFATRWRDFLAEDGLISGLDSDLTGLDYCLRLADRGLYAVHTPCAEMAVSRWRPSRPEAITWHQQNWARACARDPFYREDALATRPADCAVAMKVERL